jgi:pyrimidine operon attenuation protein/uracil phosphoribosyltransferase
MAEQTEILDEKKIRQKIQRIAFQIYEDNYNEKEIVLAGIAPRGYIFAERIAKHLREFAPNITINTVKLTVDKINPIQNKTIIDQPLESLENKVVIVVDDVLNSGKTLIYGIRDLLNVSIKKMSTAVLIDRNHKRFPIGTHYAGHKLSTTLQEHVHVKFVEEGADQDKVYLE